MLTWLIDVVMVIAAAMVVTSVSSSSCPDQCTCSESTQVVDCRSRRSVNDTSFDHVVQLFPVNILIDVDLGANNLSTTRPLRTDRLQIRRLAMDSCQVRRLEPHAFRHMAFVESIDLSNNIIEHVDRRAFSALRSLRELNLSSNRLSSIIDRVFDSLTLNSLDISGNVITTIADTAFTLSTTVRSLNINANRLSTVKFDLMRPLVNSLRHLTLSNNSVPLVITSDALSGMSLSVLDVSASQLTNLAFLENIASVERLFVGVNPLNDPVISWNTGLALTCRQAALNDIQLGVVSSQLMSSIRSVEVLDLSGNRLRLVEPNVFKHVQNLRELDLSRNLLTTLDDEFSLHLGHLERLDLSANAISTLSDKAFENLSALRVLVLAKNQLQTLSQSLLLSVQTLSSLDISDNRLHCNCELSWFRHWAEALGHGILQPGAKCSSPGQPEPLLTRSPAEFLCARPSISSVTASLNVHEGSDVMLQCTAQSDPAPSVTWSSPSNEIVTISPSNDRQQRRLSAIWQLRRTRPTHSGWYRCNAVNFQGNASAYTYVHVITNHGTGRLDMTGLVYPNKPSPLTTTQPRSPDTAVNNDILPHTDVIATSSLLPTSGSPADVVTMTPAIPVTSSMRNMTSSQPLVLCHSEVVADDSKRMTWLVIGLSVGGAAIALIAVLVLFALRRRHKRTGHYPISRDVTGRPFYAQCYCCCYVYASGGRPTPEECRLNVSYSSSRHADQLHPFA